MSLIAFTEAEGLKDTYNFFKIRREPVIHTNVDIINVKNVIKKDFHDNFIDYMGCDKNLNDMVDVIKEVEERKDIDRRLGWNRYHNIFSPSFWKKVNDEGADKPIVKSLEYLVGVGTAGAFAHSYMNGGPEDSVYGAFAAGIYAIFMFNEDEKIRQRTRENNLSEIKKLRDIWHSYHNFENNVNRADVKFYKSS